MKIETIAVAQSKKCSDICRRIVFALGALSWGFLYNSIEKANDVHLLPLIALLFIVIYCAIDITQYLQAYLQANKILALQNEINFNSTLTKKQLSCLICQTKDINKKQVICSRNLFVIKICITLFIVIVNIIHIGFAIFNTK